MKEYHNIDLYIRDNLKLYPSEVNADIWDEINIIPPKKRYSGNILSLTLLFVSLLFLGNHGYMNSDLGYVNNEQKQIPFTLDNNNYLHSDLVEQNKIASASENVHFNRNHHVSNSLEKRKIEVIFKADRNFEKYYKSEQKESLVETVIKKKKLYKSISGLDLKARDISSFISPDVSDCYDPNKKTYVFADAYYSPMYSLKNLNDRTNENENFLSLRKDSESYVYGHALGIRAGAINESGLILAAGVEASQWIEKFVYENENEVQITTVDVYDGAGNLIRTDTTITHGSRIKTTYNKHNFIDIPFSVGYVSRGRNIDLYGMIGANLNFIFSQKGEILSQGNSIGTIDSNDPWALSVYKKNAGISPHLALGASYHLDNDIDLFVETVIKTNLSSLTLSDYPLEQKHYTAALRFGVRKEIF
jgi:hypothetical protein